MYTRNKPQLQPIFQKPLYNKQEKIKWRNKKKKIIKTYIAIQLGIGYIKNSLPLVSEG